MQDLSVSIPDESLDLLSKQTDIVNRRENAKEKVNAFLHKEGNAWQVKSIPAAEFENTERIQRAINEVNSSINMLVTTQSEKKNIQAREVEIEKQIKSLKSTSTVLTWLLVIGLAVIAYFYFTH
ncbi:MAG: hypothetical protein KF862_15545 [Chitinophagaceae bacterium]|nr:hypothetical protein [Chitinophagaceae bacterium]